jgi:hypothetical protein
VRHVSTYAARSGEKLRSDRWLCSAVHVFFQTNPSRQHGAVQRWYRCTAVPLTEFANDTRRLTAAALFGLKHIDRPGCQYNKTGVMLLELQSEKVMQALLIRGHEARSERLMRLMDRVNFGHRPTTLFLFPAAFSRDGRHNSRGVRHAIQPARKNYLRQEANDRLRLTRTLSGAIAGKRSDIGLAKWRITVLWSLSDFLCEEIMR